MAILRGWAIVYNAPCSGPQADSPDFTDVCRQYEKVNQFMLDETQDRISLEGSHLTFQGEIYEDEHGIMDGTFVPTGFVLSIERMKMSKTSFLVRTRNATFEIALGDVGNVSWMDSKLTKKAEKAAKEVTSSVPRKRFIL